MTKEEFKARVSMAYGGRDTWEEFLEVVWQLHLEASNNWIPVEEELPPASCGVISDPVLVFIGNNKGWCGYIREGFYNHAAKEWSYMNRGRTHKVTHWMPIVPQRKED